MKEKQNIQLLTDAAFFLFFCSILPVSAFVVFTGSASGGLLGLFFFAVFPFYLLLQRYCRHFFFFFGAHVLLLAGAIYLSYTFALLRAGSMVLFAGILLYFLLITLYALIQRLSRERLLLSWGAMCFFAGGLLAAGLVVQLALTAGLLVYGIFAGILAVLFLLFLLSVQRENLQTAMEEAYRQTNAYSRRILVFNRKIFLIFLAGVLLLFLLFSFLPTGAFLLRILQGLKQGLLWVLRLLFRGGTEKAGEPIPSQSPENDDFSLGDLLEDTQPKPPLIPPEVIQAIVMVLLAAGAIVGIIYLFRNLSRRFQENSSDAGDQKEIIEEETPDAMAPGLGKFFARWLGPKNPTRRSFYKAVRRYHRRKKQPIPLANTPEEIIKHMQAHENNPDLSELCRAYHLARYGRNRQE